MLLDVRRAHFYAKSIRRVFIRMPMEDPRFDPNDPTAELEHSLYGTQDAAANWEQEYSSRLVSLGFRRGQGSACLFRKEDLEVTMMVHGEDFFGFGTASNLDKVQPELENIYECKVKRAGWT